MNNPISWFEIYVDDIKRAKAFYEAVFDIALEKLEMPEAAMWAFGSDYEQYGASGALVKMEGFSAGGSGGNNSTLVYFTCEDCAVEELRIESAGGKVQQSKLSIGGYGFCTLALDTEGNLFGLHSNK